ncbi:MAG TPA: DNA-directed RNA polymerase subunit alpha [Candidatus Kaiserbacteria bacterium]|nr:DNA-directed RNA polymerase subunit alpha [Candidatus Kaiserbacteria bacterium]
MEYHITLPSKPRIVSEEGNQGIYEIDTLYPGYGHTLGNSLRRIILSSLPGAAITGLKIEGVPHEFATIDGMRETVIEMILKLKRVHFVLHGDDQQTIKLSVKGPAKVTAVDFSLPSQVEIANPDQHIADLADNGVLEFEAVIERGLGYVPRDSITKERVNTGIIALDTTFTPVRRINYEVENMRVGDRTDFNRLRILIETNGTITPREALEHSIEIMVNQLRAIIGFQEPQKQQSTDVDAVENVSVKEHSSDAKEKDATSNEKDFAKMKIDELKLSTRIVSILSEARIGSVAGLVRKTASALKEIDGVGDKAVKEIEDALKKMHLSLKGE